MTGIESIAAERKRQVEAEGWSPEHDDENDAGEMAAAGAAYALNAACILYPYDGVGLEGLPDSWPAQWDPAFWKPRTPREDLVRAGALIAAEIDRLDRAAAQTDLKS